MPSISDRCPSQALFALGEPAVTSPVHFDPDPAVTSLVHFHVYRDTVRRFNPSSWAIRLSDHPFSYKLRIASCSLTFRTLDIGPIQPPRKRSVRACFSVQKVVHFQVTEGGALWVTADMIPQFATEREGPDFQTFWTKNTLGPPVEVTETLHPRYRRGDFWREAEKPDAPTYFDVEDELPEPWLPLRKAISEKAKKQYPPDTWLLVYNDIERSAFPDWGTPLDEQLLSEHLNCPFDFSDSFGRVLVMGANMKSLVEIHPTPKSWVPDQWEI